MVFAVNGQDMVVALTLMVLLVLDLALCNRLNSARQDGGFGFPEEPEEDKGKRNDQVQARGVPNNLLFVPILHFILFTFYRQDKRSSQVQCCVCYIFT